jgi:uncharacterized linocin/CFP29 family protein
MVSSARPRFTETTLNAFNDALATLQAANFYGPYALILPSRVYGDIHRPVSGLGTPADSIKPRVSAGLYQTSALPDPPDLKGAPAGDTDFGIGVLVATGANTVDRAVGLDATTTFTQVDGSGIYQFRVFERLVLRVKQQDAINVLKFIP